MRRTNGTRLLTLAAAAIAVSVFGAHAQEGEYGVLMKTLANPFWGAMGQGVEDGAKEAGVPGLRYPAEDGSYEEEAMDALGL